MTLTLTGAGPCSPGVANADLLPALVAWYSLDETTTGNRADRTANALTLTANAAPDWISGQVGAAAVFTGTESLTHADTALLNLSGKDWTVAFWFQTTDLSASRFLLGRAGNFPATSAEWEWVVYHQASGPKLQLALGGVGGTHQLAGPAADAGHWHLGVVWYDTVNHLLGMQVDNGTPVTESYSDTLVHNAANPFGLGGNPATAAGSAAWMHRGYMDEVLIWASTPGGGGVLTAGQRAELWNGGAGITYPGATVATRSYYFSAAGNNGNAGTSPAAPFLSFAALPRLLAGDTYNLRGGDTFAGPLTLAGTSNSTTNGQITVTSYGTGQAVINAADANGVVVENTSNVSVDNLMATGSGVSSGGVTTSNPWASGIAVRNTSTSAPGGTPDQQRANVHVTNCTVSGCYYGISYVSYNLQTVAGEVNGFTACNVTGNAVSACAGSGIYVFGFNGGGLKVIDHLTVSGNTIYHCYGDVTIQNTGYGIICEWAHDCLISGNVVHDCGGGNATATPGGGPSGIIFYKCTDCTARYNEVYNQHDASLVDGEGMDIDDGCDGCVLERNYTHDNDAAGYLLFGITTYPTNNRIRYNVDVGSGVNGSNGTQGGIEYVNPAGAGGNVIHNNTLYRAVNGVLLSTSGAGGVVVTNNVLVCRGGGTATASVDTGTTLAGNLYDGVGFDVIYNSAHYLSLAALHAAGGEKYLGVNYGIVGDSKLTNPGYHAATFPTTGLTAYDPLAASPAVNAGIDMLAIFGIDPGTLDFHGNPNNHGAGPDVGAVEYQGA